MNENTDECEPRPSELHRPDPMEEAARPAADELDTEAPPEQVRTVYLDGPGDETGEGGNISAVRGGIRRHGEPFLAYLILDGVEQRAPDIVEEFELAYRDYYPSREAFISSCLETLGWQALLADFCYDNDLDSSRLTWRDETFWFHLNRLYRTTERLGGVYVFDR